MRRGRWKAVSRHRVTLIGRTGAQGLLAIVDQDILVTLCGEVQEQYLTVSPMTAEGDTPLERVRIVAARMVTLAQLEELGTTVSKWLTAGPRRATSRAPTSKKDRTALAQMGSAGLCVGLRTSPVAYVNQRPARYKTPTWSLEQDVGANLGLRAISLGKARLFRAAASQWLRVKGLSLGVHPDRGDLDLYSPAAAQWAMDVPRCNSRLCCFLFGRLSRCLSCRPMHPQPEII